VARPLLSANELDLMALRVRLAKRAYGPPVAQGSAGGVGL
jgi:hypothetical protein